jgi:GNAT superfamily N-acetyltransferase
MFMNIREAVTADIPILSLIRNSVKENVLSNPLLVTEKDYVEYLTKRGKGWACEAGKSLIGFAIVDLKDHNIWALFVMPGYEGKGIGRLLHDHMLNWYFTKTKEAVWLGTAPNTRAAAFYRRAGWAEKGMTKNGEIKFEMRQQEWMNRNKINN